MEGASADAQRFRRFRSVAVVVFQRFDDELFLRLLDGQVIVVEQGLVAAADAAGLAMVFTGIRSFKH